MRILNAEPLQYSPRARAILEGLGELDEYQLDRPGLIERVGSYDVLIVRLGFQVDVEVMSAARELRAIVTATTGLDHIDLDQASQLGVEVLSLRGETDFLRTVYATPEHTWALLLALIRRIPWASASVCAGNWDRDAFKGRELAGRRLGLVGLGRVGERVARYAAAFDMQTMAFDPNVSSERWPTEVHRFYDLHDLLRNSDVVSIHAPLNDGTHGLIGDAEFASMPPGAILVNTSRGELVDEAALVGSLKSGHMAGAALDVVCNERRGASPLIAYAGSHDNLLITPHLGGATVESMHKTEEFMAGKLARFLGEI